MKKYSFLGILFSIIVLGIGFGCDPVEPDGPEEPIIPTDPLDTIPTPGPQDTIDIPVMDSSAVYIAFYTDSLSIKNPMTNEISIETNGHHISIQSTAAGMNYVLSGESSDASIDISSDSAFSVTLKQLSLKNQNAVLNIQSEVTAIIYLPDSTENLIQEQSASQSSMAGILSNGPLIFSGNGTLKVESTNNHALNSASYIRIQNGNYILKAGKDGIHSMGYILIDNGQLDITASDDGMQSEDNYIQILQGNIQINAVGEGMVAEDIVSNTDSINISSIYINGGIIDITTTGEKGMGIESDANISVSGGDIRITLSGAASKALKSSRNMFLTGGKMELITSGGALYDSEVSDISSATGIKCDGNLSIAGDSTYINILSSGSAGKGINVTGNIVMDGGRVYTKTTGEKYIYGTLSSSAKAVKNDGYIIINGGYIKAEAQQDDAIDSETSIYFNGGTCEAIAYDDAIKAVSTISITGGEVYAYSDQNDGLDAKTGIYISGGLVVTIGSPLEKKGGFETDGTLKITGGTILAIGNKNNKPSTVSSTQYCIAYSGSGLADTYYHIQGSDKHLMTYLLDRKYTTLHMIYSCPEFAKSSTYSLYSGGSIEGGDNFNNFIIGGTYSGGSLVKDFTIGGILTTF